MTLAFIARAGDGGPGDPPAEWLMPLVGDAIVGLSAVLLAYLFWTRQTPLTWLLGIVWSAIAIFDAGAAFLVETATPWASFFMLEVFGRPMFFAAIGFHAVVLLLLAQRDTRDDFGVSAARVESASRTV